MLELKPKTNSQSSNSKTLTASPTAEGQSWAERYAPTSLVDLSLHHSKRTVLTNWLTRAIEYDVRNGNRLPVLVVYGGSGIGKSSAVQILCSELGIRVVEWTQDMLESESVSKSTISDDGSYLRQIPAEMVHSSSFTRQLYSLRVNDSGRKEVSLLYF